MNKHKTGTHEEWLAARKELLEEEKELTRHSDELAQKRQELPWVPIDKEYQFETDEGSASLADLFQGRSQLLVYYFMFGREITLVVAQKLLPMRAAIDIPLALMIIGFGILIIITPSTVPGLMPPM